MKGENKFMNKLFNKIAALSVGLAMAIGVGVAVGSQRSDVRSVKAVEEVYKTVEFVKGNCTTATGAYTATAVYEDDIEVNCVNFNTNSKNNVPQWDFIKCGRKNNASVGEIVTTSSIDEAITKVVVTIDSILNTSVVNSIKLYVSSDGSSWSEESTYTVGTGAKSASVSSPAANKYYKVAFDCASHTANGIITVSKIEYYHNVQSSTPTVAFSNPTEIVGKGLSVTNVAAGENLGSSSISYSSNDTSVATVNASTGEVSGVAFGHATITAKATVSGTDYSDSYVIYVTSTSSAYYSVAQAKVAIDAGKGLTGQYVKGIIYDVESYSSQYSSLTYWISDDGTETGKLQVYSGKGLNGADFTSTADLSAGGEVVVYGDLKKYNDTYEFDKNNYLISYTAPAGKLATPVATYNIAGKNVTWDAVEH